MGVAIPLGYVEDRASGALVVDGSLKFSNSKSQRLTRTPSLAGNRSTWTFSGWYKKNLLDTGSAWATIFASYTDGSNYSSITGYKNLADDIGFADYSSSSVITMVSTNARIRDISSWYHFVFVYDTTNSTSTDRIKIYINGVRQTPLYSGREVYPSQNYSGGYINSTNLHTLCENIGYYGNDCQMSQVYFIDGQALDPSYFGYTDALTNTWRPKKFKPQATPNDGTVWSSGTVTNTGSGIYSGSWANVFDGDFSSANNNWVYVYLNSTTRLTFPKALSGLIEVYGSNGSSATTDSAGTDTIVLSDGSTYDVSAVNLTSNAVWYSFGQKTGITYIEIRHNAGSGQGTVLRSIRVNGVPLLDSDTTNMGANAFYLPFDGSAPIGQDQSGRGNNWTPVNFGGSNTLEKATGALPILNTDGGGKVARVGVRTDSSASSLVLALPLVGIKSDFSNKINSGATEKAITANGDTAASRSQSNFYGGSFYFDGTGDYLITDSLNDFGMGTGDFTLEAWVYATTTSSYQGIISDRSDGASGNSINILNTNKIEYQANGTNYTTTFDIPLNSWHHVALCRSSGIAYAFFDGVLLSSYSASGNSGSTEIFAFGRYYYNNNGYYFQGYIQDVRIYKGLAKYTQNFIPASTDPDILPDTPSGVSYTSNLTQITDGAISSGPSSTYLTLAPSADFGFGTGDFTVEFFVYETSKVYTSGSNPRAFDFGGTFQMVLHIPSDGDTIRIDYADSTLMTSNGTLFVNKWNHIALVRSGSTLSLYINGVFDKSVSNSTNVPTPSSTIYIGRYYGSDSGWINGFLSNFHVVKGTALYTSNFTPPTGPISSVANTKLLCCKSNSFAGNVDVSPTGILRQYEYKNVASAGNFNTTVPADAFDASGTSTPYYFNAGTWSLDWNYFGGVTVSSGLRIYCYPRLGTLTVNINGTDVASITGNTDDWRTITFTGTIYTISFTANNVYGGVSAIEVNGSNLVNQVFGNVAATNFNPFTANINTQRGKQSGYATLNPLSSASNFTISNGNLKSVDASSTISARQYANTSISSGKYYFETTIETASSTTMTGFAVNTGLTNSYPGSLSTDWTYHSSGLLYNNGSTTSTTAATSAGDVIGNAIDMDTGKIWFSVNGNFVGGGVPSTGTNASFSSVTGTITPVFRPYASTISVNFGQKPFKFPPPAGFQPLALANTPRPTIVRPDQFVGVSTWSGAQSGSGGLTRQISLGMQPDFVWIKQRNQAYTTGHQLYDSVRGAGAEKELNSSGTAAEGAGNIETYGWLNSFDKTGFTVKGGSSDYDYVDKSGVNYVAWTWKAGGNSNTYNINDVGYATASAAGLTAGSITPTGASVNTKSGFSIITWTRASTADSISHGLGVAPKFIICKSRSNDIGWMIGHAGLDSTSPWNYRIFFDTDARNSDGNTSWNGVPTSSVFYTGNTGYITGNMVAYCWAEIPGFSKFGTYSGNGGNVFVWCGFRPKYIMIKYYSGSASGITGWGIFDATRDTYNPASNYVEANLADAEATSAFRKIDFLSNGFVLQPSSSSGVSVSGNSYIFAAFAETPTQNLYGAQSNAR